MTTRTLLVRLCVFVASLLALAPAAVHAAEAFPSRPITRRLKLMPSALPMVALAFAGASFAIASLTDFAIKPGSALT